MDTNIRQDAYDQIKYKIIHFHYLPGQKISEKKISSSLNLGRTPVREALIRIEREGLIEVIPQSGTYVSIIDMQHASDGRFVRECVEPSIMLEAVVNMSQDNFHRLIDNMQEQEIAAENEDSDLFFDLDQAFHQEFYKAAKKESVWDWLQLNNVQLNRFRRLRLKASDLDWQTLLRQHHEILQAVQKSDIDNPNYMIHSHLHLMLDEKETVMRQFKDYFDTGEELGRNN